jgi:hypothetical protein
MVNIRNKYFLSIWKIGFIIHFTMFCILWAGIRLFLMILVMGIDQKAHFNQIGECESYAHKEKK